MREFISLIIQFIVLISILLFILMVADYFISQHTKVNILEIRVQSLEERRPSFIELTLPGE